MGHGPSNSPTVGRAVQADMGAAADLNHLLAIPTTGIGAILIEGDPTRSQGVSTSGGNQSTGAGMPPDRIYRFEQHPMLAERRFPALGADSSRIS